MADIDLATGLPALPDDHRWVVKEQMHSNGLGYMLWPTGKFEVVIEKVTRVTSPKKFRRPATTTETWKRADHSEAVVVQGNHPIAVLNAAHRCLSLWATEQKRRELLGAYPPKTLILISQEPA